EIRLVGRLEDSMNSDRIIVAELSPLDLPLVFVSQQADLTVKHSAAPFQLAGKVTSFEPKSASKDSYRLVIEPENDPVALPPGTQVNIVLRIAAAELEPHKSQPRNPPPLQKSSPRAVFLCPDHPSYLHHKQG